MFSANTPPDWPEAVIAIAFFILLGFIVWCMTKE